MAVSERPPDDSEDASFDHVPVPDWCEPLRAQCGELGVREDYDYVMTGAREGEQIRSTVALDREVFR